MNAKKLLSTLLSAVMAVTALASCGEGTNYSNEAVKAANEAQSTVVFETDSDLAKSLQDALEDYTQTSDIKTAMVADENLKDLLTSGYQLDVYAAQGEDAEAAAQAIAQQYIVNIVSGKQSEGKIAMILHKGNGYYYAAVLTYRTGGGSGSGGSGGSSSGDGDEDNTVVLTEIKVTKNPKTEYWVGDSFETSGMVITAYYSNNTSKDVTLDCSMSCTGFDDDDNKVFKTAGTYKVVFTYQGKTATVTVNVAEVKPATVTVSLSENENVYEAGEDFDPSTVTVTVKFNNGTTENVKLSDCTYEITTATGKKVTGKDLAAGKYWLSVSYEGITADSVGFAVEEVYITEILAVDGIKESYYVDDEIELNEVKVKVKYSNGETGWLPIKGDSRFTVNPTKFKIDGFTKVLIECKQDIYQNLYYTCAVEVKPNIHTVTVELSGSGSVSRSSFEVETGKSCTFDVTPKAGWELTKVTVDGDKNANATFATFDDNKVTVSNVQGDVTVTVTLTQMEYNVTLNIVGNGTVKLNGDTYSNGDKITVKHGEPLKVEATAGQGSKFVSIFDGTNFVKDGATLTITGDVNITVKFEPIQYAVTVNIDGQGTVKYNTEEIKDNGQIFVEHGKTIDLIIEAKDGWEIKKVDNAQSSSNNTYTVGPVKDNMTVTVKFAEKPYVTKIEVKTSTIKTNYECGEQLDLDNMTITVFYSNDTSKDFTVDQDDVEVKHNSNNGKNTYVLNGFKPGYWQAKFDIQYKGKTDTITVDVTCHNYSGLYTSRNCSVCENWDGEHYCKQFGSKPHKCKNN